MNINPILFILLFPLLNSAQTFNDSADVHNGLAFDKYNARDFQGAISEFTIAIDSSNPEQHFAILTRYQCRADCKNRILDYRGAINDYDKIISLAGEWNLKSNETYSNAFYYRGTCKYLIGRTDDACKDWSKAGEYGQIKAYELIKSNCSHY